jgi:septum formation protein
MNGLQKQFPGRWILASASPRRQALLTQVGFEFETIPSHMNEEQCEEADPARRVELLSLAKAEQVARSLSSGWVIGADTVVVLEDEILEKPKTPEEASVMLGKLSGRFHTVFTGFALVRSPDREEFVGYETTRVHFRTLHNWEIQSYVDSKNPMDKAGAYGIQDQSAVFVDRIEGCFYNVVGFPLSTFYSALMAMRKKVAQKG